MSVDVIKDYLVGLGFNVDLSSFSKMKSTLDDAEKSVNDMINSNSKGIDKTGKHLDNLKNKFKKPPPETMEWGF